MKTNLVKFLALSSMVLALGACTGQQQGGEQSSSGTDVSSETTSSQEEVAQVVTITELLELDADYNFALEGKLVTIEHLALQGRYANTIIGGTALGTSVTTLRGLQIDCAEFPTFEKGSGWGADISATGRVKNVNGRAVLDNAEVTVNSERDYDNPPADGSSPYSGGLGISYWPAVYMDRGSWDTYLGRSMSGIMFEAVFQLASLPEAVTTEQGTSFQVVFPGEYADVDDLENMSLITVNVPDGIGQNGVTKFNEFFEGKAVGDFVDLTGLGQYDLVNNGGYGMILESFAAQDCVVPDPLPTVYTQWAQVAAIAQGYYAAELPDLSNEKTFTYKVNTDYVTYGVDDLFSDASFVKVDHDKAVFVEFDLISKPSDVETVFNEAVADLEAAGFVEDDSDDGVAILVKYESEVAVAQADVFNQDSYVEVDYMALPLVTEFASFDAVKEVYENRVSERLGDGFATALVDVTPVATTYTLGLTNEEKYAKYFDSFGQFYQYSLTFAYEDLGENTLSGIASAYQAALVAAGFVQKTFSLFGADGLYNSTTNEFVAGFGAGKDGKSLILDFFTLSSATAASFIKDPAIVYDTMAEAVGAYLSATQEFAESLGITGTLQTALPTALDGEEFELDISSLDVYADDYTDYGVFYGEVIITATLPENADAAATLAAYEAALVAAGFVGGKTLQLWKSYGYTGGYFNSTTNEYVLVDVEDGVLVIDIVFMNAALANNANAGIADDAA